MTKSVRELLPTDLWNQFANLNAVPRASKKEERVIAFVQNIGKEWGLETKTDAVGNVLISKPASKGMENRKTVVLQSHLDMVHQKNEGTVFDFDTEGIKMLVEGDWVKADGTTLGADNGIGVATILALLKSSDIPHPPLEALFTIDEETGMTGALGLKGGFLTGEILLNLDTEDDDELTIGCAGGVDITISGEYPSQDSPSDAIAFQIKVAGLTGGHSGMEIHKGLGNANKIMNRILFEINKDIDLDIASIDGGGLRNAIPRESKAVLVLASAKKELFLKQLNELGNTIKAEQEFTDSQLFIQTTEVAIPKKVCSTTFKQALLAGLYACPSGIYRMTPSILDLVQTSNNLARVLIKDGKFQILCLTRSSVNTEREDLVNVITSCFVGLNGKVTADGAYPGWTPNPGADIVKIMRDIYVEMFQEQPKVNACHAGLECGILGTHYPGMEMISFGPNIRGAHSPDEKVQISSVQKFWKYLLVVLSQTPKISN